MSILLTGGTGQTGLRLARLLHAANKPIILASRKGPGVAFPGVKFDWYDPSTFEAPFAVDPNIKSVYLVAPGGSPDPFTPMKPFIDLAVEKGVTRFVLLSASLLEPGGLGMGQVHAYLTTLGVDYCVLRPTWFFENFLTIHLRSIKEAGTILSGSEDGKMGFISADDIADVAFDALTRAESYNTDKIIHGPELLSYDEVAKTFSQVLGRKITHTRVTVDDLQAMYVAAGYEKEFSKFLAFAETLNASGVEEKHFANPAKVSGKRTLKSFVEANKNAWQG
ncbi:NAD(P)-binding protein [Hymenopellis radicata]|nr:NAD(P)-binding protein [Hymenopellis radicata]